MPALYVDMDVYDHRQIVVVVVLNCNCIVPFEMLLVMIENVSAYECLQIGGRRQRRTTFQRQRRSVFKMTETSVKNFVRNKSQTNMLIWCAVNESAN